MSGQLFSQWRKLRRQLSGRWLSAQGCCNNVSSCKIQTPRWTLIHSELVSVCAMEVLHHADNAARSDLTPYLARPVSTMDVEEARPPPSTRPGTVPEHSQPVDFPAAPSHHPRQPSFTVTPSTVAGSSNSRSQLSSSQRTQPPRDPPPDTSNQWRGATSHNSNGATLGEHVQQLPHNAPPPSPRLEPTHGSMISLNGSAQTSPSRIKVRDLGHIQSFASEEVLTRSRHPSRPSLRGRLVGGQQYEISSMPVQDIIEMVAGLLTKITTTNDRQHEHLHRHIPDPDGSTGLSQQAKSVLAFHGKNVPSITVASYLSRIHKYCPTTYEVFLSLLVYFDRMTEMVNSGTLSVFAESRQHESRPGTAQSNTSSVASGGLSFAVPSSPKNQTPQPSQPHIPITSNSQDHGQASTSIPATLSDADAYDISHCFVVDSFNIHRLVMAGVTCASKFFSDVFYTNSRYAKVSRPSISVPFTISVLILARRLVGYP